MTSIPLYQQLLNAKSKLSHIQQSGIESIFTIHVSQASSSSKIYDEISDLKHAIEDIHKQMNEELAAITELLERGGQQALIQEDEESKNSSHNMETLLFEEILLQMNNQMSLETSIFDSLRSDAYSGEKTQDLSKTFMACMEYPPYLNIDEIKLLISLKTNTADSER